MSGHTVGPWTVCKGIMLQVYGGDTRGSVAYITTKPNRSTKEGEANARLIAKTPDLLKAVKQLINNIESAEVVKDLNEFLPVVEWGTYKRLKKVIADIS